MTATLLLPNRFLIAALYANGRVAADAQVPPLGLLYWKTLSGALVVGLTAALRGGPLVVSLLGYVITVATLAIGIALLGERYSNWVWLAVALVFLGVYLANRTARPPVPARVD